MIYILSYSENLWHILINSIIVGDNISGLILSANICILNNHTFMVHILLYKDKTKDLNKVFKFYIKNARNFRKNSTKLLSFFRK
jgi:translation initiation factor 6 (eIF-6)